MSNTNKSISDIIFKPVMVLIVKWISVSRAKKISKKIEALSERLDNNFRKDVGEHFLSVYDVIEQLINLKKQDNRKYSRRKCDEVELQLINEIFKYIYTDKELERITKLGYFDIFIDDIVSFSNRVENRHALFISNQNLDLCISADKDRIYFHPMIHYVSPPAMGLFSDSPYYEIPGITNDLISMLDDKNVTKSRISLDRLNEITWGEILADDQVGIQECDCNSENSTYFFGMLLSTFIIERIHNTMMMTWILKHDTFDKKTKLIFWKEDGFINLCFSGENIFLLYCHNKNCGVKVQTLYYEGNDNIKDEIKKVEIRKMIDSNCLMEWYA